MVFEDQHDNNKRWLKLKNLKPKFTSEMKTKYNEQTEISDKDGDCVFEEEGSHAKQARGTLDVKQ